MDSDMILAMSLGMGFTVLTVAVFVIVFVCIARKNKRTAQNRAAAPATKTVVATSASHDKHLADAALHGHKGTEEHYEEIVGSLGDVNDEGCADLDGVRFISHDAAYDGDDSAPTDYNDILRLMVLGDVLNTPRFKRRR